jgi:hypothetical protein
MQPPLLQYEPAEVAQGRRPFWVYVVVALYVLVLLGILVLPAIAWQNSSDPAFVGWLSVGVAVFMMAGGSLLLIPLRVRSRRPLSQRSIWIPLVGSSICIAILALAGGLGLQELLKTDNDRFIPALIAGIGGAWIIWLVIFGLMARRTNPQRLGARLYKSVFVGSVLELLVAVPMHVVVRRRTECCAGMQTGFAIAVGAAMAVIALGPAVFVLYHRRWKQVYEPKVQASQLLESK